MADLVCTLPQRSVFSLLQRSHRPRRFIRKQKQPLNVYFFSGFYNLIRFCLSRTRSYIMKPSGCFVGLPVSRREPRRRCGGRRGGLNDSQHCAVGPGLQSPQRWSFPPASISLAVSLHSTRSSSSLSLHPTISLRGDIFSDLAPAFLNPTEGDYFYSRRPNLSDLRPKVAPRVF